MSFATGRECIINIYVILGRRNLFEMGAVRSPRESRSVALVLQLGILVTGTRGFVHVGSIIASRELQLGGVCFFLYASCII